MFCHQCGNSTHSKAKFCQKCGSKMFAHQSNEKSQDKHESKMNEDAKFLWIILLVVLLVMASLFGIVGYSRVKKLEQENLTLNNELISKNSDLAFCEKELKKINEEFGKTTEGKKQAEELAKAAELKASENAAEVLKQKNIVNQKTNEIQKSNQELSGCQYYLNLAANLADILDVQKQYYREAGDLTGRSISFILSQDYGTAINYLESADKYFNAAESYENQVASLIAQFR